MKTFPLVIGTPDGILYEGEAERVVVRSMTGDLAILAGHQQKLALRLLDEDGRTVLWRCDNGQVGKEREQWKEGKKEKLLFHG